MGLPVFHGRIPGGAPRPRFLIQVAAVAAILVVIAMVRPGTHHDVAPGASTGSPSTGASSTVEASPHPSDEGGVYEPSPVGSTGVAAARRVAAAFATAWARPDLPAATWWRGVAAYAEPGYAELLRSVEPANVPASRVTGTARTVRAAAGLVVVDVPTDAGTCRVTVADTAGTGEWKVSTHSWRPGSPR
jgi:hypothetical protein